VDDTAPAGRPHRNAAGVIVSELLHGAAWIVELVVLAVSFLGMILTIPLLAEAERWAARLLGSDAPSGHRSGAYGRWLWNRILTPEFWRRDLPTTLSAFLLSLVSCAIVLVAGMFGAVFAIAPFLASADHPIELAVNDRPATTFNEVWWSLPLGLAILIAGALLLRGIGAVRLRVVEALARDAGTERAEALEGQVAGLRRGRATLVDAYEAERTRIERDLHDGAQQSLVALAMTLGTARMAVSRGEPGSRARAVELLDTAQEQAESSLRQLREVVRGIHPQVLSDLGLRAAVEELCARSGVEVATRFTGDAEPSAPVSTAVYFAIAEALTNVARHAGTDRAEVALAVGEPGGPDGCVRARIVDHGAGGAVVGAPGHTGLSGLVERLEVVGGSLDVDSPPGGGTTVSLAAPLVPPWQPGQSS
jgi:signal transduction histidine kinase